MGRGSLRERAKWALDRAKREGWVRNAADLAKRIGIERASVSGWLSGATKSVDRENAVKAGRILRIDPDWLSTGTGKPEVLEPGAAHGIEPILSWEHEDDLPAGDYVQIPRFEVHLSAGGGDEQRNLFQMQIELLKSQPLAFRADWIRKKRLNPSKLASMQVVGDSMEDRLHDGDAIVIDTSQTEVSDGNVYALWYDGGERVKRLYRRPGGGLIIHSDNESKYPQLTLTPDEANHVRIIGRVVHVSGEGGL